MALKDLVADRSKLDEEAVERVVSRYVRYDPAVYQIVFTPDGARLGTDAKILVYLVALIGWQYVVDDVRLVSTKPADLESALGIHGGTLRPALKKLKDAHLLSLTDGHYSAQIANLEAIERLLAPIGVGEAASVKQRRNSGGRKKRSMQSEKPTTRRAASPLKSALMKWLEEGYFSDARTLSDIVDRYHEQAIITKQSSLSGLLLEAVRDGELVRTKVDQGAKRVWGYRAK